MENGNQMIKIIYEDNHLLVVEKPANIPVQADISKDKDLLTTLKEYLKKKYNKPGNVYLGLVHRLDRPVSGIMVFAKTSKAAKRLSEQIAKHEFKKTYLAVVHGNINDKGSYIDKIQKNSKLNKSFISEEGKKAELNYKKIDQKDNLSLVEINLKTGRSHQIRVQFSYHGYPLYGDQKYNPNTKKDNIALFSHKIEFRHPITNETIKFSLEIPDRYPFNIFKISN